MSNPSSASTPEDRLAALEAEVRALKAKAAATPKSTEIEREIDDLIVRGIIPARKKPEDPAQYPKFLADAKEAVARRIFDESKSKKISLALRQDVEDGEIKALDALASVGIDPFKKGIPTPSAAFLGPFTENPAQTVVWLLIGVFGAAIVWSFL